MRKIISNGGERDEGGDWHRGGHADDTAHSRHVQERARVCGLGGKSSRRGGERRVAQGELAAAELERAGKP